MKKIITLDNEEDIVRWAQQTAMRVSPETRIKYYEKTEPKDIVKLVKEQGLLETKAKGKVENIIASAIISGFFVNKEKEISEADFIEHMEGFYIPRMKELHIQSNNWFVIELQKAEPTLFKNLAADMGVNWSQSEYIGSQGKLRRYALYDNWGTIIGECLFDPSAKTFEFFL